MNILFNNVSFASSFYKTNNLTPELLNKFKDKLNNVENRPKCVKEIYSDSVEFLSKKIDKDGFLDKLYNNLNEIYYSQKPVSKTLPVKLEKKEENFFKNTFMQLDEGNYKDIPEEDIIHQLKLLV